MTMLEGVMRSKRADGWWYPWIFVGGMALVVLANGIMAFIALSTWTGLETEGHYQKGLDYNRNLAAAEAQAALGWTFELEAVPAGSTGKQRDLDLQVAFRDRDGHPLDGLEVSVLLQRPTHEGYDQEVRLKPNGPGLYAEQVTLPLPGQWAAHILAARGASEFQDEKRLRLR